MIFRLFGRNKVRVRRRSIHVGASALSLLLLVSFSLKISAAIGDGLSGSLSDEVFREEKEFTARSAEISDIFLQLKKRSDLLGEREEELLRKEISLKEALNALEVKVQELDDAEQRLKAALGQANNAAADDVQKVVSIYSAMKPKDAAAVFELMEPALSAGMLSSMKPAVASEILAKLSPETSYAISVIMAGRNAK